MKYWEHVFMAFGVGCLIGAVITPTSYWAAPVGGVFIAFGWYLHKKGAGK